MANNNNRSKKWIPWEGAFRVAGEGCLGIYQGSNLWTREAAEARAKHFVEANIAIKIWIEVYESGIWKKIGNINNQNQDVNNTIKKEPWFYQFYK